MSVSVMSHLFITIIVAQPARIATSPTFRVLGRTPRRRRR